MNEYLFLYSGPLGGEAAVIVEAERLDDAREIWRQNVVFTTPLPCFKVFAVNRVRSVARALATQEKQG